MEFETDRLYLKATGSGSPTTPRSKVIDIRVTYSESGIEETLHIGDLYLRGRRRARRTPRPVPVPTSKGTGDARLVRLPPALQGTGGVASRRRESGLRGAAAGRRLDQGPARHRDETSACPRPVDGAGGVGFHRASAIDQRPAVGFPTQPALAALVDLDPRAFTERMAGLELAAVLVRLTHDSMRAPVPRQDLLTGARQVSHDYN